MVIMIIIVIIIVFIIVVIAKPYSVAATNSVELVLKNSY